MRAYLIDPFAKKVTTVETDGTLETIYSLVDCHYVEAVRPEDARGDLLLIDEEGKLREGQAHFICHLWPHDSLAGKALWIGSDGEEFAEPRLTMEQVTDNVSWLLRA
jgi:hypothetical protein